MSNKSTKEKSSVYEKRALTSIPAPLEPDSDSDFNAGEWKPAEPEPKKRGRKAKKPNSSTALPRPRQRGKRKADDLDDLDSNASSRKQSRRPSRPPDTHNPLLEYFDTDLGLHSASEDEPDKTDIMDYPHKDKQEELEEHSGSGSGSESEVQKEHKATSLRRSAEGSVQPSTKRTGTPISNSNLEPPSRGSVKPHSTTNTQPPSNTPAHKPEEDNSATESEPDEPVPPPQSKRRLPILSDLPPSKRVKSSPDDSSGTEDEPEIFVPVKSQRNPTRMVVHQESDSETQSEEELDPPELESKPRLPLPPNGKRLGPLLLGLFPPSVSGSDTVRPGAPIQVPGSINTYLREYQRDGVRFFWDRYIQNRGGLLGDDMGLGKTIQVIAFLSAIMRKHGDNRDIGRRRKHVSALQDEDGWVDNRVLPPADATWPTCLIIAPASVVRNWEREFEVWGYFEVGMYTGDRQERKKVLGDFKKGRLDVLLAGFETAVKDITLLDDLPFSLIIIDEAHRVKNPVSKTTKAFNQFECLRRFGLTGTTIQNSYMEMWTILDWTSPGKVGSRTQWKGFVVKPLTIGQSAGAGEEERLKALSVAVTLKDKLLPRFFIRRTKEIIRDQLPKKTDQVVFCPLTTKQTEVYKRVLAMEEVQDLIRRDEICECDSGEVRKNCCHPFEVGNIFKYMDVLIKLSNHLALILPAPTDNAEQTARNRQLAKVAFPYQQAPKYGPAILQPELCGKWTVLNTLLLEWRQDRSSKVLIFTKSVKLLEMLEFHLSSNSYGWVKLDGSVDPKDRMDIIDKFHQDPDVFVFLISTMAGGTGLNLTGANKVVIFDPNWNPASDLQAMDRAYRFGQTRDVSVYRLLGAGSIEELIYARQLYKQQQMAIGLHASVQTRYFRGVQGDKERQGELFGLRNIFKLHEGTYATKMAIETATMAELDWALAHMGGTKSKNRPKGKSKEVDWVYEAESKGGKETELRGLGALLFDDDPPALPEEDDATKTLNNIGIKYTHRNDQVLIPSRVEEQRAQNDLLEYKKKRRIQKARASGTPTGRATPEAPWPPVRRVRTTPEERLAKRQQALIELGYIMGPAQFASFAADFVRKTKEEQDKILSEADDYIKRSGI